METLRNSIILGLCYLEIFCLNYALSSPLGCKTYKRSFWEKTYSNLVLLAFLHLF